MVSARNGLAGDLVGRLVMVVRFDRQLAESIERLEGFSSVNNANGMQEAMSEADALFSEIKSIGELLTAAYNEIVGIRSPLSAEGATTFPQKAPSAI